VPAVRDGVLVIAGIGGGLAPELRTGDVVVADQVWYVGGRGRRPSLSVRLTAAQHICDALKAHGISARTGGVVTVDRLVMTGNRHRIGQSIDHLTDPTTGTGCALAVDLESVWLLRIPARLRCVIRVVADPAGGQLLRPSTLHSVRTALGSLTETVRALAPVLDPATAVDPNPMSEHHQEVDAS
jgi:4-hydroxy-3-methylbut-2-enyl diphosphate reductase